MYSHFLYVFVLLVAFFIPCFTNAQELQLIRSIPFERPVKVSADIYDNIFVSNEAGVIMKMDSLGNHLAYFSPQTSASISNIEAWATMRVFLYYADLQEYTLLDRRLGVTSTSSLEGVDNLGYITVATLSWDGEILGFDQSNINLIKYSDELGTVTTEIPLAPLLTHSDLDINFIKAYQNLIFINDLSSGIIILDALGQYQRTLEVKTDWFACIGDELYWLEDQKVMLYHLYEGTMRNIALPQQNISKVLMTTQYLIGFTDTEALIYLYK